MKVLGFKEKDAVFSGDSCGQPADYLVSSKKLAGVNLKSESVSLRQLEKVILNKICYWDVIPMDKCDKVVNDKKWFDAFCEGRDAAVDVLVKEFGLKLKAAGLEAEGEKK